MSKQKTENPVTEAINEFGLADLAREFGLRYQTIRKWEKGRVPAERVREFVQVTGIPKERVRPDIFSDDY